jgi:Tfp pilus assembly protein PilF
MTPLKRRRSEAEARAIRADAQLTIGLSHLRQGRNRDALAVFDEVLRENPEHPRALTGRALALGRLGLFDDALDAVEALRRLDPEAGRVYSTRATIYEYMDRPDDARADFERALALEPNEASHHYNYACFFAKQGDAEKVRLHLGEALHLRPGSNAFAATDKDFAAFRDEDWFQELVAFK